LVPASVLIHASRQGNIVKHLFNTQSLLLLAAGATLLLAGCATQNAGQPRPGSQQSEPGQVYGPSQQTRPAGQSSGQQHGDYGQGNSQPAPDTQTTAPAVPVKAPPKSPAQVSSPAVMSLLGSADTLAKAGHMDASASTLERALDIEPRNPFVYQRLSAVRLAQGQAGQAEQMAMKSNSVAGDNPYIEAGNWRLISEARRTAGDSQGASQASERAVSFKQATSQYGQ